MPWPPRVRFRRTGVQRRNRAARKLAAPADAPAADGDACHYCERTDGTRTRDHKVPRMYGGKGLVGNIVLCCQMCNIIKAARGYEWFVVFFRQFLEVYGDEYRTSNPDDWATVGAMTRRFNAWLHELQHADAAE